MTWLPGLLSAVVFLPLAFISGVTGGFFKALAVTMEEQIKAIRSWAHERALNASAS